MQEGMKYYEAKLWCTNCEETKTAKIEKGTTIRRFMLDYPCPDCGCHTLEKD